MSGTHAERTMSPVAIALTTAIVALAIIAGAIHLSLGGMLFTHPPVAGIVPMPAVSTYPGCSPTVTIESPPNT